MTPTYHEIFCENNPKENRVKINLFFENSNIMKEDCEKFIEDNEFDDTLTSEGLMSLIDSLFDEKINVTEESNEIIEKRKDIIEHSRKYIHQLVKDYNITPDKIRYDALAIGLTRLFAGYCRDDVKHPSVSQINAATETLRTISDTVLKFHFADI